MSNKKTLYCFGDSWGEGAELRQWREEKPFCNLLANEFLYELENYSKCNMSLGLILKKISEVAAHINEKDVVLVVIPPDCRWYTEWETLNYNFDDPIIAKKSLDFYKDKTDSWFEYHHQLFVFSICELLNKVGCQYLLMHNYGRYPLEDRGYYFSKFYHDKFLSSVSLTGILTNADTDLLAPIPIEVLQNDSSSADPKKIFFGPYFEGTQSHPNQKGHIKIADLIKSKILF